MKKIRRYSLSGWLLRERGGGRLFYRPGFRCAADRLGVTLVCGALLACVTLIGSAIAPSQASLAKATTSTEPAREMPPAVRQMYDRLPPEIRAQMDAKEDAERRQARTNAALSRQRQTWVLCVMFVLMSVLGLLGLWAPLSVAWESLTLDFSQAGMLTLVHRNIRTRTLAVPIANLEWPAVWMGRLTLDGEMRTAYRYWWYVCLQPRPTAPASTPTVEFCMCWQKDAPVSGDQTPAAVREFLEDYAAENRLQ
jgi:hypothetical protein